jgi:hypothetical protein
VNKVVYFNWGSNAVWTLFVWKVRNVVQLNFIEVSSQHFALECSHASADTPVNQETFKTVARLYKFPHFPIHLIADRMAINKIRIYELARRYHISSDNVV